MPEPHVSSDSELVHRLVRLGAVQPAVRNEAVGTDKIIVIDNFGALETVRCNAKFYSVPLSYGDKTLIETCHRYKYSRPC